MLKKIICHLEKSIARLENTPIGFWAWIFTALAVIFIRNILEIFSNHSWDKQLFDAYSFLLHFPLFYLSVILSLIIVIYLFSREKIDKISQIVVSFLPVIWLAPLLDLLFTWGRGRQMTYLFAYPGNLPADFFSFFGPFREPGVTLGMRLEIALILTGIGVYIFLKTKNWLKSALAALTSYTVVFFHIALPSLISIAIKKIPDQILEADFVRIFFTGDFFDKGTILSRTVFGNVSFTSLNNVLARSFQRLFDLEMAQIFFVLIILGAAVWFYFYNQEKFWAVVKNARFLRIAHYLAMFAFGLYLGRSFGGHWPAFSFFDCLAVFIVALAIVFSWLSAVCVNDAVDLEADKISNPGRPLVKGILTAGESKILSGIFLAFALLGAALTGYYSLIFILIFNVGYYLYSVPPLKLKRFPFIAKLFIGLNSLVCVWAGFFLLSGTNIFYLFPAKMAWLILISYALAANVIDIKDFKGDEAAGVKTIPVIFGERRGKIIISAMVFAALILVPVFLQVLNLLWISILFGGGIIYLINRKNCREKPIFILYLVYLTIIFLLYRP